jgi:hypothetical protein
LLLLLSSSSSSSSSAAAAAAAFAQNSFSVNHKKRTSTSMKEFMLLNVFKWYRNPFSITAESSCQVKYFIHKLLKN